MIRDTGDYVQNGASRPLLVLILWPQLWEASLPSLSIMLWFQQYKMGAVIKYFSNSYSFSGHWQADVNSIATSRVVVRLEKIWTLCCVACVFGSVSLPCAILSPSAQVHCMVSVASCSWWMNSTAWQGGQKYICWFIKEAEEWRSWLYDNKAYCGLESPIPLAYRRL